MSSYGNRSSDTSQALVRFLENQYISYIDMDGERAGAQDSLKGIFMLPGHAYRC